MLSIFETIKPVKSGFAGFTETHARQSIETGAIHFLLVASHAIRPFAFDPMLEVLPIPLKGVSGHRVST
jgi:hypothetical protein